MASLGFPLRLRSVFLVGFVGLVSGASLIAYQSVAVSATGAAEGDAPKAEVGSCAAYSGLPSEDGQTAGKVFVPAGTFAMRSDPHQPEERFTHAARADGLCSDPPELTN